MYMNYALACLAEFNPDIYIRAIQKKILFLFSPDYNSSFAAAYGYKYLRKISIKSNNI